MKKEKKLACSHNGEIKTWFGPQEGKDGLIFLRRVGPFAGRFRLAASISGLDERFRLELDALISRSTTKPTALEV